MANPNKYNTEIGRRFQERTRVALSDKFDTEFDKEVEIAVGDLKYGKKHKFDLANSDRSILVECKCYSWTDTGNVPSAKLRTLNEAVLYFKSLSEHEDAKKIICMKEARFEGKSKTLAEYYVSLYEHLLQDIGVYEISEEKEGADAVRVIRECAP